MDLADGPTHPVNLSASGLGFSYPGGSTLFRDVSLDVGPGTICTVGGLSGCGKSTLLYLLGLMLTPDEGSIALNGTELGAAGDRARSARRAADIGFVFQDAILDGGATVMDNIVEALLLQG